MPHKYFLNTSDPKIYISGQIIQIQKDLFESFGSDQIVPISISCHINPQKKVFSSLSYPELSGIAKNWNDYKFDGLSLQMTLNGQVLFDDHKIDLNLSPNEINIVYADKSEELALDLYTHSYRESKIDLKQHIYDAIYLECCYYTR